MEFSPLYTRRLSGNSTLNSFKEDALEQLEFNINDISRASSPASVISISARSEGHGSFRDRRYRNSGRGDDEYRRKYSQIKAELELQRMKAQQFEQEREEEMRKWKDAFENDRRLQIVAIHKRVEEEKKREINKLKEDLLRQKDFELQQVLIYQESERKQQQQQKEQQKEQQKAHRVVETQEKGRRSQEFRVEKDRADIDESEENTIEKDGDNDIAVASGKVRARASTLQEARRKRRSAFSRRSLDLDSKDGGPVSEHKRSSKELKSSRSQDGLEAEKENNGRRRRGSGVSSRSVDKVESPVVKIAADVSLSHAVANDNTASKNMVFAARNDVLLVEDSVTSGKSLSFPVAHKSASRTDPGDSHLKKIMVDQQTQVTYKDAVKEEEEKVKDNERQTLLKELHEKITGLECEKSALLTQKDEIQTLLDVKCREQRSREDEFMSLKMGYERELRTVINEHRKIVLENMEKLKFAENVLKEATLTEEEISLLSQQHERKRRLSTSSLPALQIQTKKEDKEKEKTLQKKLGELTTHVQRLERRIALLRTENEALKKKQDDQKPLEEKIRSLKKRNAELAAIARRLEEKAKALQQENIKARSKTATPLFHDESSPEVEHLKRVLARQRAKDLSEHAKSMLSKDKEIEDLRRKCQELADLLSNGDLMAPQNAVQFEEKVELVNIIKQAAKERLQLEQQLAHLKTKEVSAGEPGQSAEKVDQPGAGEKYRHELEEANEILHRQIEKLEQALQKAGHLEQQLIEKTSECASLSRELAQSKNQQQKLEEQLSRSVSENQQLNLKVQQLQEQAEDFEKITEECNTLKLSLATVQKEREAAEEEVKLLNLRVHSLENVVRDLQESAENANHFDKERKNALQQLQEKQAQLEQLHQINTSVEGKHAQTISALNKQILELEDLRKAEERRREELATEVQRLHKEAQEQQRSLEAAEHLQEKYVELSVLSPDEQSDTSGREENKEVMDRKSLNQNERSVGDSLLSSWAQKGPIQVYIAKYNYDPFEFSPNENPEAELPLTAGDYVLVVGEMDEDGFFDGELIDGRQGLVPSNFIEKVEDEDLIEFHAALLQAGHGYYSNANMNSTTPIVPSPAATSVPATAGTTNINNNNNDTGFSGGEAGQPKPVTRNASVDNPEESFSDLEDIAEIDEDDVSVNSRTLTNGAAAQLLPPCPRSLCLDRQLTNSLLVSWRGPDTAPGLEVQSYQVLVDGQLKTSVMCTERTKALIEGVSSNSIHRVCVRCLSNRGLSKDVQCTMLVGKDVYPVPSELKVSHVTPTSATLSWLPGNSNYQHSIVVNGKEVRVVKPGVFRSTLSGLVPGTLHKVTLIAKSISGVLNEEKSRKWVDNVSASIEFRTPEAGTTEPPLNVQVESGPRVGTILLTWLPVTINSSGICNGVVITGYNIVADGRKVQFVPGPTSDHVVLSSEDFKGIIPTQLSVRTVSKAGLESVDSELVLLPQLLIKEMTQGPTNTFIKPVIAKAGKSPSNDEQKDHDTDEEIEEAFREAQNLHKRVNAVSEPYSDSSSSELSDIPEVEEDLIASQDSRLNEVSTTLTNQTHFPSQVEKGSPQPAPRKLVPSSADAGPKEFHAQKPTAQSGKLLAAPTRIVPAIEIIRDSSTERGTSADEDIEDSNTPSTHSTPTNVPGKGRVPDTGISASFGDAPNLSAFRQVDQTRHKDSADSAHRAAGVDGDAGDKRKTSRTQPTIGHPSKPQPADSRAGHDSQNPKQRHGKAQSPWTETSEVSEHRKPAASFLPSPLSPLEDAGDTDSISGEINTTVDANTVRLFIALFDYDPVTMSPNVDSIDEELPFREGQILKVFGDKDADGFYKGENLGRIGYIPCNMVSEVQIDDPDIVEQLLQETAETLGQANPVSSHSAVIDERPSAAQLTPNGVASIPQEGPVMRKMIAMYDYDPQELSPNVDAEMELSFKTGDIVMIYGDMDEDGFYTGEVNGQQGLVPSNFLQPAPSSDDDGLESASLASAARSRSGESLDAALNALARTDIPSNVPKIGDQLPPSTDSSSNKPPVNIHFSEIKSEGSRPGTSSPADDEKPKKKGGFLNKSKNIFKKFTR